MPPAVLLVLSFEGMPLWAIVCFLEGIDAMEEAFLGSFWIGNKGDLECRLKISMKTLICGR